MNKLGGVAERHSGALICSLITQLAAIPWVTLWPGTDLNIRGRSVRGEDRIMDCKPQNWGVESQMLWFSKSLSWMDCAFLWCILPVITDNSGDLYWHLRYGNTHPEAKGNRANAKLKKGICLAHSLAADLWASVTNCYTNQFVAGFSLRVFLIFLGVLLIYVVCVSF